MLAGTPFNDIKDTGRWISGKRCLRYLNAGKALRLSVQIPSSALDRITHLMDIWRNPSLGSMEAILSHNCVDTGMITYMVRVICIHRRNSLPLNLTPPGPVVTKHSSRIGMTLLRKCFCVRGTTVTTLIPYLPHIPRDVTPLHSPGYAI